MQTILPLIPAEATPINDIVSVWREGSPWTYFLGMNPVYSHRSDDLRMFCLTIAQWIDTGNSKAFQIIETFGISKSRVDRAVRRYRAKGVEGFFEKHARSRRGTVMTQGVVEEAQRRLDTHESRRAISDDLGVGYATLVKAIQDGRLKEPPKQPVASGSVKSERSVLDAEASAGMGTACLRTDERLLTALGKLQGAPTRFEECRDVSYGGVLCALPALLGNGLLSGADKLLGQLKGYYQAMHVLLLLGFMALSRIKTPEQLRGKAPGEFGKLLGLDRIPEVRCLRNKMDELAQGEAAERWAAELSRTWMQDDPESVGTLYVDGHVRVYHGHQTKLPRKYVSRERLCLRGTNNYWINDAIGRPFFVIEKVVDSGMLNVLREEIVPRLLREVPNQPTQEQLDANPYLGRFILVFDREGYSPDFFRDRWRDHRIACITYHKHPESPWPESEFFEQDLTMPNGEKTTMRLAERGSMLGRQKRQAPEQEEQAQQTGWMREVRKLNPSGHQTSLISTAYELDHTQLAARLFSRWCQENYFRYMMQHFAIDLLSEYGLENLPDTTQVVNPLWRELTKQRNSVLNKLKYRQARFAELTLHPASAEDPDKLAKWEKKKAEMLEEIQHFEQDSEQLKTRIKDTEKHIRWDQLDEQERFKKPLGGRKRLMDAIRMIAYRAETAMSALITGPTIDTPAARRLLQDLFLTEADIHPDPSKKQLLIRVHRSSRPAADQALQGLFEQLNDAQIIYPGTDLSVVYNFVGSEMAPPEHTDVVSI